MAKILVIDDSVKTQKFVHTLLSRQGHEVLMASDVYEGVELLDQFKFDLLILDVNMPYKDGFSALQSMRKSRRFQFLNVIFLSARNSKRDIQKAISLDAEDYVIKPINSEKFMEKVKNVLEKRKTKTSHLVIDQSSDLRKVKILSEVEGEIIKLSEVGVDICVNQKYCDSQDVIVRSPLFTDIGIDPPFLKVLSCEDYDENYILRLSFTKIEHQEVELIRHWLKKQG